MQVNEWRKIGRNVTGTCTPSGELEKQTRRRSPWFYLLATTGGLACALTGAIGGLAAVAALVYPTNIWVAVAVGVVITFLVVFSLNLLRRKVLRLGQRKIPVNAIITTGVLATLLVAICWVPSKTYASTGSTEIQYGIDPELINTHTGDRLAVYVQKPQMPNGKDPILFISGGPGGSPDPSVKKYLQKYVDRGYTTYAYDPIGVRNSPRPKSSSSFSMAHEVGAVKDILDHYGIEEVNLIAHSYGGNVAARFIEQDPNRVNAYLSVDTAPVYSLEENEPGQKSDESFQASLEPTRTEPSSGGAVSTDESPKSVLSPREEARVFISSNVVALTGADRLPFGDWEEVDYYYSSLLSPPDKNGKLEFRLYMESTALLNASIVKSPNFTKNLRKISSPPVLVVHPEFGIVPWGIHDQYREFFSNARFITAEGAGHGVWVSDSGLDTLIEAGDALFSGEPIPNEYTKRENPFPPLD